jgi:hypothetical protein
MADPPPSFAVPQMPLQSQKHGHAAGIEGQKLLGATGCWRVQMLRIRGRPKQVQGQGSAPAVQILAAAVNSSPYLAVRFEQVVAMLDAGNIDEARAAVTKLTGARRADLALIRTADRQTEGFDRLHRGGKLASCGTSRSGKKASSLESVMVDLQNVDVNRPFLPEPDLGDLQPAAHLALVDAAARADDLDDRDASDRLRRRGEEHVQERHEQRNGSLASTEGGLPANQDTSA